jgi:alkaline phosphatase D
MLRILLIAVLLIAFSCTPKTTLPVLDRQPSTLGIQYPTSNIQIIAFGSCDQQNAPQNFWSEIIAQRPDLWIWLGDIIYADTTDMNAMQQMYLQQKQNPFYQQLRATTRILGVWDDHDYGTNDGDKTYPKRAESKNLLLDFLDVPADAPVRRYEGAYQSYTFGEPGKRVKVLLLDGRYFRDELQKGEGDTRRRYLPNPTGDILGEAQWQWLERELTQSDAQIHLIGSGIQVLSAEHPFEKWSNFPAARQRLLDLLVKTRPAQAILLSGDRHTAELSKMDVPGLGYPLYDLTSSGLTHAYTGANANDEPNAYRIGKKLNAKNYAMLKIDWNGKTPQVTAEIRAIGGGVFLEQVLR